MNAKNKWIPYIVFGVPVLIGLYFVYKAIAKPKGQDAPPDLNVNESNTQVETTTGGGGKSSGAKYFPLKKGSRGAKVKELQNAILAYDKNLLPKFGADGDFGTETENAVKTLIGKTTVDSQEDINAIINKRANDKKTADAKAAVDLGNANRNALAAKLFSIWQKDKNLRWSALYDTKVTEADITSDGREVNLTEKIYKKGDKIPKDRNAQGNHDALGFITWVVGKKSYYISPYGFELT